MRYIPEKILREHIRQVLRERDIGEEELTKDEMRQKKQESQYKNIPQKHINVFTNAGDYDNNPAVRAQTDAIMSSTDKWLTYAGLGLTAIGVGLTFTGGGAIAGIPLVSIGEYMVGLGLAANVLNASLKFQNAVIKGNETEAATHLATLAIDIALGGLADKISKAAGTIVAARRAGVVANAKRLVAAKNLGYGAGQVAPTTKMGVRAVRAAAGSISGAQNFGNFVGGSAASAAIIQIYNLISGELTDIAIEYDEERKRQGLEPDPNLTKEVINMSERFSQGKPSLDDIGKMVVFGVNSGVFKSEDAQALYESFLAEASGESLTDVSSEPNYGESPTSY